MGMGIRSPETSGSCWTSTRCRALPRSTKWASLLLYSTRSRYGFSGGQMQAPRVSRRGKERLVSDNSGRLTGGTPRQKSRIGFPPAAP